MHVLALVMVQSTVWPCCWVVRVASHSLCTLCVFLFGRVVLLMVATSSGDVLIGRHLMDSHCVGCSCWLGLRVATLLGAAVWVLGLTYQMEPVTHSSA